MSFYRELCFYLSIFTYRSLTHDKAFICSFSRCFSVNFHAGVRPDAWSVNSRSEILRGDAHGVSIDDSGNISLAPKLTEIFKTEQPYIWSSVADASGNVYLGSGSDGKILS